MSEENVEIIRRMYADWARGDLQSDCYDPEIVHERIGSELPGINGEWKGLEELEKAMASYLDAFADLRLEAEEIIDLEDDRVLVLVHQTARGKTSGLPWNRRFGDLFTLRDGKVVRYVSYWDRAEALEAAGLEEK